METMGHEHVMETMGHEHVMETMGHEHVMETIGHEHVMETMGHEYVKLDPSVGHKTGHLKIIFFINIEQSTCINTRINRSRMCSTLIAYKQIFSLCRSTIMFLCCPLSSYHRPQYLSLLILLLDTVLLH